MSPVSLILPLMACLSNRGRQTTSLCLKVCCLLHRQSPFQPQLHLCKTKNKSKIKDKQIKIEKVKNKKETDKNTYIGKIKHPTFSLQPSTLFLHNMHGECQASLASSNSSLLRESVRSIPKNPSAPCWSLLALELMDQKQERVSDRIIRKCKKEKGYLILLL